VVMRTVTWVHESRVLAILRLLDDAAVSCVDDEDSG